MPGSRSVVEVTADTFQREVVEQSARVPVVVDFWAPWCAPCKALGPVLESLAAEKDGAFVLAKVNTDDNPELAGAFQVNGIPAVFAVRNGEVIDHFEGLLPEDELRRFIDGLSPTAADREAADAQALEGQNPADAQAAYRTMLATDPTNPAPRLGLARVLLAADGNEAEAAKLLDGIDAEEHAAEVARLKAVVALRAVPHAKADLDAANAGVARNPDDAAARLQLGRVLAALDKYPAALAELLAAAERDKALGAGAVREAMVRVFAALGPQSAEATAYRKKLQMLLY